MNEIDNINSKYGFYKIDNINITNVEYYAIIRSYIETCYCTKANGHKALVSLMDNNPYLLAKILEIGKQCLKKRQIIAFFV